MDKCGTKLAMSTTAHPESDGQTERVNRVIGDVMRSYATAYYKNWSILLPMAEFALNNAVHSSHGYTPFFVNNLRHPRVPILLGGDVLTLSEGGNHKNSQHGSNVDDLNVGDSNNGSNEGEGNRCIAETVNTVSISETTKLSLEKFLNERRLVIQMVQDCLAKAVDQQKEHADKRGRKHYAKFKVGDQVLLSTKNLKSTMVSNYDSNKLLSRFIGPFKIIEIINDHAYKLDIPTSMKLHNVFYVGLLKPYVSSETQIDFPEVSSESGFQKAQDDLRLSPSRESPSVEVESSSPDPEVVSNHAPPHPYDGRARRIVENEYESGRRCSLRQSSSAGCHDRSAPTTFDDSPSPFPRNRTSLRVPAPLIHSDGSQRYVVESIVDHKKKKNEMMYLVKWLGYQDNTWEPHSQLSQDVPDVVSAYWNSRSN